MSDSMQTVNHTELAQRIELCYLADQPLFIHGTTGIGKSDTVREVAKGIAEDKGREFVAYEDADVEAVFENPEDYFVFVDHRLAQSDPSDVKGLPDLDKHDDATEWKPPKWIKVVTTEGLAGIVFCDELNLAPQLVQAAYYEIILDKKAGNRRLADDVYLVGAGNRTEDQAHIREMPAPLRNRFGHVELKKPTASRGGDDVAGGASNWINWAASNSVDGRVIGFLSSNVGSSQLFNFDEDNRDASVFATPRSWEMTSDALKAADDTGKELSADEVRDIASIFVGPGVAAEFRGWMETRHEIDVPDFLENPEKVAELDDKRVDLKYALITSVAEEYRRDTNVLDEVIEIAANLDTEFGSFLLRLCRQYNQTHFQQAASENETFKKLSEEYVNFII